MLWLSITNALLGAAVLVCLVGFAYAVASEFAAKLRGRSPSSAGVNGGAARPF
jgi:hypothetical protein